MFVSHSIGFPRELLTSFFLGTGNGVDCIRSLSTEALQKVNRDVINPYRFPRFGPGPIVDGDLIPDAPAYLLAQGRFHKNITILVSNDIDEVCPLILPRIPSLFAMS